MNENQNDSDDSDDDLFGEFDQSKSVPVSNDTRRFGRTRTTKSGRKTTEGSSRATPSVEATSGSQSHQRVELQSDKLELAAVGAKRIQKSATEGY